MEISGLVKGMIIGIIGLVIVVTVVGSTVSTVATAGNTVNATGYPLASLFASNSILPLLFLGAALVAVIALAFGYVKTHR